MEATFTIETHFIPLHDMDEWQDFATANEDALLEIYPDLAAACKAACEGGITLGGGAQPIFEIRFVDEE